MSDTRRLVDEGSSPAVMALLRAAHADRPPNSLARAKTLSAIAAATATGAAIGKGGGAVALLMRLLSHSGAKLALAVALGGGVGVTTLAYLQSRQASMHASILVESPPRAAATSVALPAPATSLEAPTSNPGPTTMIAPGPIAGSSPSPRPAAAPAIPQTAPAQVAASPDRTAREAPVIQVPLPTPARASVVDPGQEPTMGAARPSGPGLVDSRPPPTTPAPSSLPAPSLASELTVLDEARAAVAARNGKAALSALDRYRAAFPRGVFTAESTVLRIEALLESGNRREATAVAESFLRADPAGPYAKRVRELLAKE
jgi:hypothetical protein